MIAFWLRIISNICFLGLLSFIIEQVSSSFSFPTAGDDDNNNTNSNELYKNDNGSGSGGNGSQDHGDNNDSNGNIIVGKQHVLQLATQLSHLSSPSTSSVNLTELVLEYPQYYSDGNDIEENADSPVQYHPKWKHCIG